MGELPVEDAAQAVGVDQQVAEAEVAVDDGAPGRRGAVRVEPADAELHGRKRLVEAGQQRLHLRELVAAAHPGGRVRRDGVDRCEGRAGLADEAVAGGGPLVVAQELAGDGLALEAVHDDRRAADHRAVVVRHDRRHGHAPGAGGPQERGLALHPGAAAHRPGPQPLEDQGALRTVGDEVEREGLPRSPARQPDQPVHRTGQAVRG